MGVLLSTPSLGYSRGTLKEKDCYNSTSSSENLIHSEKSPQPAPSKKETDKKKKQEPICYPVCVPLCGVRPMEAQPAISPDQPFDYSETLEYYDMEDIKSKLAMLKGEQASIIEEAIPLARKEYALMLDYHDKRSKSKPIVTYPKKPCGPDREPNLVGSCPICQEFYALMKPYCTVHYAQRDASHELDQLIFRLAEIQANIKMLDQMKTISAITEEKPGVKIGFEISKVWNQERNGYQLNVKGGSESEEFSIEPPKLALQSVVEPRKCWPFTQADLAKDRLGAKERVDLARYAKYFERWTIVADENHPDLVFRK